MTYTEALRQIDRDYGMRRHGWNGHCFCWDNNVEHRLYYFSYKLKTYFEIYPTVEDIEADDWEIVIRHR